MIRGAWTPAVTGLLRVAPQLGLQGGLAAFVRTSARRRPHDVAWVDAERAVTWAGLWRHTQQAACTDHRLLREADDFSLAVAVLGAQLGGAGVTIVGSRVGATTPRTPPRHRRAIVLTSSGTGSAGPRSHPLRRSLAGTAMLLGLFGALPLPRRPRVACLTRLDHGHGFMLWVAALALGGTYVARGGPLEALDVLSGVPLQLREAPPVQVPLVLSGSDRLEFDDAVRFAARFGGRVVDAYGATEFGTVALDGQPMPGVKIRVLDEQGHELPDGTEGLVEVRSPLAARAYRLDRGRIVRGRLDVTGRAHGWVSAGENVDPQRLRAWLLDQPGVRVATVDATPDERYGQRLVAAVGAEASVDLAGLKRRARAELGPAHAPVRIDRA